MESGGVFFLRARNSETCSTLGAVTVPLVELKEVTVRAGGRTLLENVTLRVAPGEALRLAGPNGGGKTTLLRLLAGQVAPVRGERVYGLGGGLHTSAVQARRSLSVVGPDAEAFYLTRDWEQTVRDVLLAGFQGETLNLWEAGTDALSRLNEVVALTGLVSLLERDVRTLSHGQRRRVMLARALMPRPKLLLLDEFTDGLSAAARAELSPLLQTVHATGTALVLATHRPDEAPNLNWRTVYVQHGKISNIPPSTIHQPPPPASLPPSPFPLPVSLVRLSDVNVFRNGHPALGPISWAWEAGQHWLVTGENGSGKSTLARLIAGEFHPALGGHVERPFLKRDLLAERRRSIGVVSAELGIRQRTSSSGRRWTGRDVIGSAFAGTEGFMEELTAGQGAWVSELAERLELTELLEQDAETLSQGQLRRLLLARAVVHRPTLLILDEGLDFVDADSRARFVALLPELVRGGTHLMVIAHRANDTLPGLTHHLHLDSGQVRSSSALI